MTAEEMKTQILEIIDDNCRDLSLEDYIELLEDLASDFEGRADAARHDLEEM